jgi:protein TIF31
VPLVKINLPAPSHARTTPKSTPRTLNLLPQSHETLQELKLAINESIAGYWLGPYSLRLPVTGKTRAERPKVENQEGGEIVVKEGERLSEWLEVGDIFYGYEDGEERTLDIVRGMSTPW